jgi:hypothetical protein
LDENLTLKEKIKVELGFVEQRTRNIQKHYLENRLSLYSDYINKFGNVDIDYDLTIELVVNDMSNYYRPHIIYDDDIKAKEDINGEQVTVGPKHS